MKIRFLRGVIALGLLASSTPSCFYNDCDDLYDKRKDCGLTPHDNVTLSADSGCEDCAECMLDQSCETIASGMAYIICGCRPIHCSSSSPCPPALTCDIYNQLNDSGNCVAP
jgi:hypothetical protein